MTPKEPEYMFPELQGLPEEFRRLAEAEPPKGDRGFAGRRFYEGRKEAFTQAAQMLEEKLNADLG